jgi:DNA-binding SARP family transcriptional activator
MRRLADLPPGLVWEGEDVGRLDVRLFGPFQVTLDGEPITGFRSDKVRALLAYLCTETTGPHRREKLAGMLWPDWPESAARANLRRALTDLRSAIRHAANDRVQPSQ